MKYWLMKSEPDCFSIDDLARKGSSVADIYETITTRDVQLAADLFRPLFDRLDGRDGFRADRAK